MTAHDAAHSFHRFHQIMMAFPGKKLVSQPDWVVAVLVTFAIGWLHFYLLFHAGGFWRDEVNVINLAHSHSLSDMAKDSFPILLPLLINGWTAVGLAGSDVSLRLLGVLIGFGMPVALLVAAWIARRSPPLLSLTLLGINGTVIFWGDSLRAYGLGSVLVVVTLAAMCAVLKKPTWQRTTVLAFAAVLSVQTLYHNAVLFASIGLGGWLVCLRRKDKVTALKILAAGAAAAISLLPYWNNLFQWHDASSGFRTGFSFMAAAGNFDTVLSFPLPQYVWIWTLLGSLVIGLAFGALFRRLKHPDQTDRGMARAELQIFAGTTLLAALASYAGFLKYAGLVTEPWYFLPPLALGAICIDLGLPLEKLPRLFRVVVFGLLLATAIIALAFASRDLHCRFTNLDIIAKQLQAEVSPQDYIVVTPWYMGISFDRYYRGAAAWDTLPPVADHSIHRFDLVKMSVEQKQASQAVLDRITATLHAGHRVWVVGEMSVPAPGRPAFTEEGRYISAHSLSFEKIEVKAGSDVSEYENASLLLASGWRTNQP